MKTKITVSALPGFPEVSGPHELAWSYLLDAIFADAFHARLEVLHVQLPSPLLVAGAELRSELSKSPGDLAGAGVALLGQMRSMPRGVCTAYILDFGRLAPRRLQAQVAPKLGTWRLEYCLSVFTLKAKLWGIPIRLASGFGRPDLADRAMLGMRQDFACVGLAPSYYRLSTWRRA